MEDFGADFAGPEGQWGGIAKDNRLFMNAVLWILRTGAPWRDLPSEFGKWSSVHQRFRRWRDAGVWERILSVLAKRPDFEWLMIDATHCKVHSHAAGAIGGNEGMDRTKGAQQNSSGRGAVSLPFRAIVTEGTRADRKEAIPLIKDLPCKFLLADRGYDTDEIIKCAKESGIQPVIPPKKNRKIQRSYDEKLYKERHLVENTFLRLKRSWRGIAIRYAKRLSSFAAFVHLAIVSKLV